MKFSIVLILVVFLPFFGFGQKDYIEDHNSFSPTRNDLQEYAIGRNLSRLNGTIRYVPVQVHALVNYDNTSVDVKALYNRIMRLNEKFAPMHVAFFLADEVHYINQPGYFILNTTQERNELVAGNSTPKVIDLFLVGDVLYYEKSICGEATLGPEGGEGFILVRQSCLNNTTMEHEFGHYFGLRHTHDTTLGAELVNGSNCLTAGDQICDTPADPDLSGFLNLSCQYIKELTATDANGDLYTPDPANIMSYANDACKNSFTRGQYEFMDLWYKVNAEGKFSTVPEPEFYAYLSDGLELLARGSTHTIQFDIQNFSPVEYSGSLSYTLRLIDENKNEFLIHQASIVHDFSGFERLGISQPVLIGSDIPYGYYQLVLSIDTDNQIPEIDELNEFEKASKVYDPDVMLPDLSLKVVGNISDHGYGTGYVQAVEVENVGNTTPSININLRAYVSGDSVLSSDDVLMWDFDYYPVVPGGSLIISPNMFLPRDTSLPIYVIYQVDQNNHIEEINEENNTLVIKVKHVADNSIGSNKTDYEMISMNLISGSSYKPLQTVVAQLEFNSIINQGEFYPAGTFSYPLHLILSADTVPDENDRIIFTEYANFLSFPMKVYKTIPALPFIEPGNYYLIAVMDFPDHIEEVNEGNNMVFSPVTIGISDIPVVEITNITMSRTEWTKEDTFLPTSEITIRNIGEVTTSGNWELHFFVSHNSRDFEDFTFSDYTRFQRRFYNTPVLPGESATVSSDVNLSAYPSGEYYLAVCFKSTNDPDNYSSACYAYPEMITIRETVTGGSAYEDNGSIEISPNPVKDYCQLKGLQYPGQIQVHSVCGELLLSQTYQSSEQVINLFNYTPGLYFITVTDEKGNARRKKVFKF